MRFSTRTEYGLRAMVNLASSYPELKSLSVLAREESLPLKYLERIMNILKTNHLVASQRGQKGGYVLIKNPSDIDLAEIITCLEGSLSPMKCVGNFCHLQSNCSLKGFWENIGKETEDRLRGIRLNELVLGSR